MTAAGYQAITERPLTLLSIWGSNAPDADSLKKIAIPSLEVLDLNSTPIGDDAFREIARCPNLRALTLPGSKVTDAGLAHL